MKRGWALLTVLAMTAGTLAGCGGSKDAPAAEQPVQEEQAAEGAGTETAKEDNAGAEGKTEITFWHYMSEDKEGKFVNEAVEEFNNSQDEIYVNAQYLPSVSLQVTKVSGAESL